MEGKRRRLQSESQAQSVILLTKIKEFTRALLTDLTNGRSPLILIDRFRSYCAVPNANCFCASDLPCGKEALTLRTKSRAHRLVVMLRVMLIVQKLLQENKHSSKRDIYYTYPSLFLDQSVVDQAINDICILMQCSRHNLNVVSAGNGLIMGWIRFSEGERKFDCISSPNSVHPVPVRVEDVQDIISVAQYILVVEKESVFQRLANDQFCNTNHCIVITGRGYPDIPTRRFLRLLVENLRLPVYCLVDCDPYGFDILTTYRFGSMQMAYDTKHLRVPEINWLGAFPSDSERYFVPKQCLLPLTAEDKRKVEAMLLRCYLQREVPQWRLELKLMLQKGVKFEIEALSAHALSFLSDSYIPSKIERKLIM
ncbi:meiotic recombination protein SPO11-1 [Vigna unguiculata]|uniref:meiotic recombination protein SPO11-1 n=1 Tax=Vigna unguiculata TaxID=3917 RepID=UPI0010165787|nr:meiotic recombination protein SPO11-1 [Vigna unguiculata]